MNTRALLPLMPLLTGCLIVSTGDENSDGDGNGNDSTTDDGDGDPTTGDGDGDPTTGDGDGDGDPTGDGDGDPTGDGDGDGDMWCGLSDAGPDEPWFTLRQAGTQLNNNSDLELECGFQGFFMIEIDPRLGGFVPSGDTVPFSVTLDVDGFNLGPNGHFATGSFNIYVACCEPEEYEYDCYYNTTTFQLFPPDAIVDLSVIHEAPAQLSVTMNTPLGPVTQQLDVQMWALEQNMNWQYCGYYQVEPLPVAGLPIPE
jgi:hypothetical protein